MLWFLTENVNRNDKNNLQANKAKNNLQANIWIRDVFSYPYA